MSKLKKCSRCEKKLQAIDKNYPFCSDRCKLIDLGNWASETYKISKPVDITISKTENK